MYQKTEQEIMENWKGDLAKPIVSVCCTTYNHEPYIAEAIDSFLMQETNFPFEVLIRDDCSTDETAEIVKQYADRYPQVIKPVYEKENTYSRGIRPMPQLYKIANGKYIALCEGDDYWTDPLKLKKQVGLLEKYTEVTMSVAYTDYYEQTKNNLKYVKTLKSNDKELQSFEEIKRFNYHTSSYMIKADILEIIINDFSKKDSREINEAVIRFMLISYGPFVLLPEVVSVYRITGKGVWTSLDKSKKWQLKVDTSKVLIRNLKGKYRRFQGELLFTLYWGEMRRFIGRGSVYKGVILAFKVLFYGFLYKIPRRLGLK